MKSTVFGAAQWIWPVIPNWDERDRRVHFRKDFELNEIPGDTTVCVSADAYYSLYVNGIFVHRGPARGLHPEWPFDRIDLAPYLKAGRNVIAALGYQYGVSNYSYSYANASGFIFNGLGIKSDISWKMREAPGYIRAVAKGSMQYAFQEFFDCGAGDGDWTAPDYDDSNWHPAEYGRAAGSMPWNSFEERNIPLLTNHIIPASKIVSASAHAPANDWRNVENILATYHRERPEYKLPDEIDHPTCIVWDFGREVVGMLRFEFEAEDAMDFMVCEMCDGLTPRFPEVAMPMQCYGGRLYPGKGTQLHELTMPWGFRYVVVFNRGGGAFRCSPSVRESLYPLAREGAFHSSDKMLNAIWKISEHAQRCCMVDSYIDCPWREYAQWWGDALVQAQNTFRLAADARLLARGLRTIGKQRTPNGLTYAIAPSCGHRCILPDYSAMYLVTLEAYYFQTGSLDLWEELKPIAEGIMGYFEEEITPGGLVPYDPRYWLFVDWCPTLNKIETYNLIILWGIRSVAKLAGLTDDKELMERCRLLEAKLLKGLQLDCPAPHAAALAILLDVRKEQHEKWLHEILLPMLAGTHQAPDQPGTYFMYYIFEAVKQSGFRREVIDCIRRWWGEFVDANCSATPEQYLNVGRYWSFCHAWSAHPVKHFSELLLGVRPTAPAWREIEFDPVIEPGQKFTGSVPTPYGPIDVFLDYTGDELHKKIILPPEVRCVNR